MEDIGRLLLFAGIGMVFVGGFLVFFGRFLPNLPTFRMQVGSMTCLFPIGASILISVIGTIVLNIIIRILR